MMSRHPTTLDSMQLDKLYAHLDPECPAPLQMDLVDQAIGLGTRRALEAVFDAAAEGARGDDRDAIIARLAAAPGPSASYLIAQLAPRDTPAARLAAEILARRGITRGLGDVIDACGSPQVYEAYVARGPRGIRTLCQAVPLPNLERIAQLAAHLASRRRVTEATVRELLDEPHLAASVVAAATLGQWDEPWSVEALMTVAADAARPRRLRDEALEALAHLQAPEAGELLAAALDDETIVEHVRAMCANGLGLIGNTAALPALRALVERGVKDAFLRECAEDALRSIETGEEW